LAERLIYIRRSQRAVMHQQLCSMLVTRHSTVNNTGFGSWLFAVWGSSQNSQ